MTLTYDGARYILTVHEQPAHWRTHPITLDYENGERGWNLSVNQGHDAPDLPEGAFWLKDWSENEEIAEFLCDEGYLEVLDIEPYPNGYVDIYAARLTNKWLYPDVTESEARLLDGNR